MARQEQERLLGTCLSCLCGALLCLLGCQARGPVVHDNPLNAGPSLDVDEAGEPLVQASTESRGPGTHHDNDLERLSQLAARVNSACRASYAVVLGGADTGSGPVSIDYALFDRLSDDGSAVLIAEAILGRRRSVSLAEGQSAVAKAALEADEVVGRCVAEAGFGSGGFAEWLQARKPLAADSPGSSPADSERMAAFMRGYSSERYGKGRY